MLRAVVLLFTLSACGGPPPVPDPLAPRPVVDLARWRVEAGDRHVGWVVEKEIRDPRGPIRFFQVENAHGQWLGYVDAVGRVYRREPFATGETFVGMYAMDKALGLLYDEPAPMRLTPSELRRAAREASQPR